MVLRIIDNETLVQQEQDADRRLAERQNEPLILGLSAHLKLCWDAARQAKKPIENIMLRALRQRNGEYEADKLAQINQQGGSDVYMMITEVKCRAAESWLRDILLDQGSPLWGLEPTPIPDLSPGQTQEIEQSFAEQVIKIVELNPDMTIETEVLLLKVSINKDSQTSVIEKASLSGANSVDVGQDYAVFELTGSSKELNKFEDLMKPFGIIEMVRGGRIAIQTNL